MSDRFGITENGTNDTKALAVERKPKDTVQSLRAFYKHLRQSERFKKVFIVILNYNYLIITFKYKLHLNYKI